MLDTENQTPPWNQTKKEIPNGEITIQNIHTGEHRTFRVKTQKPNAKFAPGKRVVSFLYGPDNTFNYRGFGFVADRITPWKNIGREFQIFSAMLNTLLLDEPNRLNKFNPADYTVLLSKHCVRCNRLLTTPESIADGIGPECRNKWGR